MRLGTRLRGVRRALVLGWVVTCVGRPQDANKPLELRIVNAEEVAASIYAGEHYSLVRPHLRGDGCENQPTVGGYGVVGECTGKRGEMIIEANVGRLPADRVRVVVFNPRCETENLDVAMLGKNETRTAKCVAVPIWRFQGRIEDDALTETKGLKVHVGYQANWALEALGFPGLDEIGVDQPPPEPPQFDVATVSVSKDRSFSIALPIYAHDHAEEGADAGDRGELVFTLLDTRPKVPVVVGTLRPDRFATKSGGLELRTDYPALQFVVER